MGSGLGWENRPITGNAGSGSGSASASRSRIEIEVDQRDPEFDHGELGLGGRRRDRGLHEAGQPGDPQRVHLNHQPGQIQLLVQGDSRRLTPEVALPSASGEKTRSISARKRSPSSVKQSA